MLSSIVNRARSDPRTSLAGLASFLSFCAGILGTVHTGQVWPLVAGTMCSKVADLITAALAADAKGGAA